MYFVFFTTCFTTAVQYQLGPRRYYDCKNKNSIKITQNETCIHAKPMNKMKTLLNIEKQVVTRETLQCLEAPAAFPEHWNLISRTHARGPTVAHKSS